MDVVQAERKPFDVTAVRVTADNITEVSEWCGGDIRTAQESPSAPYRQYVLVRVQRPLGDRQTMAFVGDWVLYAGTGYKVYTNGAFNKAFQIKPKETNDE